MNPLNETVVDSEMMKQLRDSGLDRGYETVPKELEGKARELLQKAGGPVATMDADMKRRLRNRRKAQKRKQKDRNAHMGATEKA